MTYEINVSYVLTIAVGALVLGFLAGLEFRIDDDQDNDPWDGHAV